MDLNPNDALGFAIALMLFVAIYGFLSRMNRDDPELHEYLRMREVERRRREWRERTRKNPEEGS